MSDSVSEEFALALVPTLARAPAFLLQSDKGSECQHDVIALRSFASRLTSLDATALLQASVVLFDEEGFGGDALSLGFRHRKIACCPELRVFLIGIQSDEHPNQPVALQVDFGSFRGNGQVTNVTLPLPIQVDEAIGLQARQPVPPLVTDRFEIGQTGVPTVEANVLRGEPALLGGVEHRPEMRVFGHPIHRSVGKAAVKGKFGSSVCPQQGDEIDAVDTAMMLAAPVFVNECDVSGMRLVEGAVVEHENPARLGHESLDFAPQCLGVGRQSLQQTSVRIVGRRSVLRSIGARGFREAKRFLSG